LLNRHPRESIAIISLPEPDNNEITQTKIGVEKDCLTDIRISWLAYYFRLCDSLNSPSIAIRGGADAPRNLVFQQRDRNSKVLEPISISHPLAKGNVNSHGRVVRRSNVPGFLPLNRYNHLLSHFPQWETPKASVGESVFASLDFCTRRKLLQMQNN